MATLYEFQTTKTFATKTNAIKAVEKLIPADESLDLRYFIMTTDDGRFFPVFIGEKAVQAGLHFHFHVVA